MGRNCKGHAAPSRSARRAGHLIAVTIGLAALTFGMGAPVSGAAAGAPAPAPTTSRQSSVNNDSCQTPANVWTGRFTAHVNSSGSGTGSALVACFPDQAACEKWLARASGNARGAILLMRCRQGR